MVLGKKLVLWGPSFEDYLDQLDQLVYWNPNKAAVACWNLPPDCWNPNKTVLHARRVAVDRRADRLADTGRLQTPQSSVAQRPEFAAVLRHTDTKSLPGSNSSSLFSFDEGLHQRLDGTTVRECVPGVLRKTQICRGDEGENWTATRGHDCICN